MKCLKCDYDNLPESNYCESCGEPLIAARSDQETTEMDKVSLEASDQMTAEQEAKPVFLPVGNDAQVGSTEEQKVEEYPTTLVPVPSGKKKSSRRFRAMLTAIILAVALIAGLGFLFRNKILKIFSPERYLQVSLSRTFSDEKFSKMIDMSKYDKKAVGYELTLETEGIDGEVSVMYDAKGEKALFEAILDDGTTVYDDNLLYISRKMIAISIPEVLTETEFVTIDPETFAEDLEEFGAEESFPPDFMDKALDVFFGKSENGKMDMDKTAEYYREAKFLEEHADFSQGKSVTEEINGKTYKLDTMCYEIAEEDANQYLQDFFDNYKQGFIDGMESAYQGYDLEAVQDSMDSTFDMFDDIRIEGDIIITYYVDSKDYVRKIVVDEFELTMTGEEEKFAIEFEIRLGGKKNPTDNISAILGLTADGEKVELFMDWEESYEKGVFQGELDLYMEREASGDTAVTTIEIEWDTKDKSGENFKAEISIKGQADFGIKLTGTLIDSKTSTTFTDGELSINFGYGDGIEAEFEYSISIIDPKDISIDIEDSMSIWEYAELKSTSFEGDDYLA
jgi:hypothetical protein